MIREVGMALNDRLDDYRRQWLRPYVVRALGTANDGRDDERRQMCNEYLLHDALPNLFVALDRQETADKLLALPVDLSVENVRRTLYEVRTEAWKERDKALAGLRERIKEELRKRGLPDAAAAADAAAVADADAAADAAAAAVAAADLQPGEFRYRKVYYAVRDAVRKAVREKADTLIAEKIAPLNDELFAGALGLLDRMLPPEPLMPPVVDYADIVCAAPESNETDSMGDSDAD